MPDPVPAAPDAAATAALAQSAKDIGAADRAFAEALKAEEPAIGAGRNAAAGSERWASAQLALSRLQAAHLPATDLLQSIDDRRAASADGMPDTGLDSLRERAAALVAAQEREISRLSALLAR